MNTIEIKKKNAISAYNKADTKGKQLLENLLGKDNLLPIDITERVKIFEDVFEVLEDLPHDISSLLEYKGKNPDMLSAQAYLKLTLIARALNEGWEPDWTNSNEYKYMPYFKHKSGFGLSFDGIDRWDTVTTVGSRLCYKSRELAEYAATQFADIYNDYLTIK